MKMVQHNYYQSTAQTKRNALILVSLMMLSIFVSALHFTLVPHSIDFQSGKVVHSHAASNVKSTHGHRHSSPKENKNSNSGHECGVFVWMQQAKIFQNPEIVATVEHFNIEIVNPLFEQEIHFCRSVYPISPSHSPPVNQG